MRNKPETTKETQARSPKAPARPAGEAIRLGLDGEADDIVNLILKDHGPLKELIKTLKDSKMKRAQKETPLEKFVPLLATHAKAEESTLYVQMKESKELRMSSYEGDTEHAIAEQLFQEINATPDDDEWNAKVKVLAELVEHHIQEEESDMLKLVEQKMDVETRQAVGTLYTQMKQELESLGRPRSETPQSRFGKMLN